MMRVNSVNKFIILSILYALFILCTDNIVLAEEAAKIDFLNARIKTTTYVIEQGGQRIGENTDYGLALQTAKENSGCTLYVEGVLWHNYPEIDSKILTPADGKGDFNVYQYGRFLENFKTYEEAYAYATRWDHSAIIGGMFIADHHKEIRVIDMKRAVQIPANLEFDNHVPFSRVDGQSVAFYVYQNNQFLSHFDHVDEAIQYAEQYAHASVRAGGVLWENGIFTHKPPVLEIGSYAVYQNDKFLKIFSLWKDAAAYGAKWENSCIIGEMIVWHNFPKLDTERLVTCQEFVEFDLLLDAVQYAKQKEDHVVIAAKEGVFKKSSVLWAHTKVKDKVMIENVPYMKQNPELPRGCEVTSLAMLLNYNGVVVDKMQLAKEIKKSPLKYDDLNNGFVGDMYSLKTHGLGVYHKPIVELAQNYMPNKMIDMTGCDFEDLFFYLNQNQPVWIITNSRYRTLPASEFVEWNTPSGKMNVTYRMHSVLVVGYDERYIYFNDPLTSRYAKAARQNFIKGWIQMGRQAVVCQ